MKKVLFFVMAFSLVLTGCRKEANQVVSRPLSEAQGIVVAASPTPTPTPRPTRSPTPTPSPSDSPNPPEESWLSLAGQLLLYIVVTSLVGGCVIFCAFFLPELLANRYPQYFAQQGDGDYEPEGVVYMMGADE
jgi:hypothetical protein